MTKKNYFYDYSAYSLYESNYKYIINNIYEKILKYYKFEKEFSEKIKLSNKNFFYGYLVDIDWFNKWEKYYHYLDIKFIK